MFVLPYFVRPVTRICLTSRLKIYEKQQCYSTEVKVTDDEFRVLELYPDIKAKKKGAEKKSFFRDAQVAPPREKRMKIDQDWPSVWPTPQTFRPSVVPLPVYQGYDQKRAPPGKYANAELMKIPNFLHLTPPAIKRHCAAIKQFCTEWPRGLETEENYHEHFPVEIITSDYCHSSPVIRDERSRIVTLKVKLRSLKLDYHGRDKLIRLIGNERYDKRTDTITIVADRCPLRKQNYDYLIYLLTAIHHESWITEPWEHEKTEADMEKFFFEGSRIQKHIVDTISQMKSESGSEELSGKKEIEDSEEVEQFGEAVSQLINEGENDFTILKYKESVLKALNIGNVS
ncbi:28S ribosomal protein S35, mitochondrial, partial [Stegodyphus mimosarum]